MNQCEEAVNKKIRIKSIKINAKEDKLLNLTNNKDTIDTIEKKNTIRSHSIYTIGTL